MLLLQIKHPRRKQRGILRTTPDEPILRRKRRGIGPVKAIQKGEYPPGTIIGGIQWKPELTDERVFFENWSERDYDKVDFTILSDVPIIQAAQLNALPGCYPVQRDITKGGAEFNDGPVKFVIGDFRMTTTDKNGKAIEVLPALLPGHDLHFRCSTIPSKESLPLVLAVSEYDAGPSGITLKKKRPSMLQVRGSYIVDHIKRNVEENVTFLNK